ncbi:hypothetical protein FRC17_003178, partial [Serendipita sp. 399]
MQSLPSQFDSFFDPPPIFKLSEVSLQKLTPAHKFPFVKELLPRNPLLLYTPQSLSDQGIDLEYNLLWYHIPSVRSVVFFTWQKLEGNIPTSQTTVPQTHSNDGATLSSSHLFISSLNMENVKDDLFVLVPCTYRKSKAFYDGFITEEGRKTAQNQFMESINVLTDEQLLAQVKARRSQDTSQPSNTGPINEKGHSRQSSSSSGGIFENLKLTIPSLDPRSFLSDTSSSSEGEPDEIPDFPLPPLLMRYATTVHTPGTPPKKQQTNLLPLPFIDDPDYEDNDTTPKCFRGGSDYLRSSFESNRSSASSLEDILW